MMSSSRPVFTRSGSISADQPLLPSIETPRCDSSGSAFSSGGFGGVYHSNNSGNDTAMMRTAATHERPRLISVDDQPPNLRRVASLSSSMALLSTATDWSVFDGGEDDGHCPAAVGAYDDGSLEFEFNRKRNGSPDADAAADRVVLAPVNIRSSIVNATTVKKNNSVAALPSSRQTSTSQLRQRRPTDMTTRDRPSDGAAVEQTQRRLTRSNRTLSYTNLSRMSSSGDAAGVTTQTGGGGGLGGGRATWTRPAAGGSNGGVGGTGLQRHRSEANVNRIGWSGGNGGGNVRLSSLNQSTNFKPQKQNSTTRTSSKPAADINTHLPPAAVTASRPRHKQAPTAEPTRGATRLIKSTSQPILRRDVTAANASRWYAPPPAPATRRHSRKNVAAARDAEEDGDGADDAEEEEDVDEDEDEPTDEEKRQRIFDWLDGLDDENAEPPPTPEIDDEPVQTDTAIHIIYKGD
jgi:hypothetical protein